MSPEHGKLCAEYLFLRNIFFFLFFGETSCWSDHFSPLSLGLSPGKIFSWCFHRIRGRKRNSPFFSLGFYIGGKMGGEMMVRVCRFVQTRRRHFSSFFLWEPDCGRALPVNNSIKTSLWGSAAVAWGKHSNFWNQCELSDAVAYT